MCLNNNVSRKRGSLPVFHKRSRIKKYPVVMYYHKGDFFINNKYKCKDQRSYCLSSNWQVEYIRCSSSNASFYAFVSIGLFRKKL